VRRLGKMLGRGERYLIGAASVVMVIRRRGGMFVGC
jgi:hypothetical protein